jgi:hypothetical protein
MVRNQGDSHMARKTSKTSKKSTTCAIPMTELEELMIACPGLSVADADAVLAGTRAARSRNARNAPVGTPAELKWEPVKSLVFPKPVKRITSTDTDFVNRLSSKKNDDKKMREFLAGGGEITVLPTRNAKGLKKSRMKASSGKSGGHNRSRKAHTKHANAVRHDAELAALNKNRKS